LSPSISPSISPSVSPSISPSVSPSPATDNYSRGDLNTLPSTDNDLETIYSETDENDVATKDDTRVCQTATNEFMLHQYKDDVGSATTGYVEWEGQTSYPPSLSTVFLQIYNQDTPDWETIDSDNTSPVNTDFTLSAFINNLTNYKNGTTISCRVYQEAI